MITWGVSANSHNASLTTFDGDKIVFSSHSERFSRIKNDPHLNSKIINYALQWGYPSEVIWYEDPILKSVRQLKAGQGWKFGYNNVDKYMAKYGIHVPVNTMSHHQSHAAAGYYTSGFEDATVVVIDSIGEFETLTVWEGSGQNLHQIFSQGYPHSIGLWYSAMTQRLGLKPNEEEYILMGMSAFGDGNKYFDEILDTFFDLAPSAIDNIFGKIPTIKLKHNLHRGCLWWKPDMIAHEFGGPTFWAYDVAAATQRVYEMLLETISREVRNRTTSNNLVLMGGCALNCSANTNIYNMWDNVWIMPDPGDSGSSIGSVLAYRGRHIDWPGPYLGYEIEGTLNYDRIISELESIGLCGIARGHAEIGPRALGNRSLIADPRTPDCKRRVNHIKQRQEFRPFAPAILAEYADEYFDGPTGPYMQYTPKCREPERFPSIVHTDGTSRVQTVTREDNPSFRELLELWYDKTGCPMLLNTSLNIKGQPMVNDLGDARDFKKKYGVNVF
jgi:carbamoyltransferase